MIFNFFTRFPLKKKIWKKFLKGFLWKIEAGGKILKGFPFKFTTWLVLHVLHFIGNFFYNPRASLARAAFKRDFLISHGGRRSIAGTAQATPPHPPPSNTLPSYIRSRAPTPQPRERMYDGESVGRGWVGWST